eukprot:SAG31_NODE_451_length_15511_cov_77.547301_2_plen_133_part_00
MRHAPSLVGNDGRAGQARASSSLECPHARSTSFGARAARGDPHRIDDRVHCGPAAARPAVRSGSEPRSCATAHAGDHMSVRAGRDPGLLNRKIQYCSRWADNCQYRINKIVSADTVRVSQTAGTQGNDHAPS